MKDKQLPTLATLIVLLCLSLKVSYTQAQTKLVFSTIENSVNAKVSSIVMVQAYKRIGVEINIIPLPAKRSLIEANAGKFDGELFRLKGMNKNLPNLIPLSIPINYLEGVVITKNFNFEIDGWKSLRPFEIGIRRGIRFSENGTFGMNRQIVNSNKILFNMLEHGRLDVIVVTRSNGLNGMKALNYSHLNILEPSIEVYPLFHYLHVKNEAMIPKIESVLRRMQHEGLLQKIRRQVLEELQ